MSKESKEKKPKSLKDKILVGALVGGVALFAGYDKLAPMLQDVGKGAQIIFSYGLPQGTEVIVYTFKTSGKPSISDETSLGDYIRFYKAVVTKPVASKVDTYDLEVTHSSGSEFKVGQIVKGVSPEIVYKADLEIKEIKRLNRSVKLTVFTWANKKISRMMSSVSDFQLNLADAEMDATDEIRKFLDGRFLDSDAVKISGAKKIIDKAQRLLAKIYEMDKNFYQNFGSSVVNLERITDIEMFYANQPYGSHVESRIRLMHYFESMGSSFSDISSLLEKTRREGFFTDLDGFYQRAIDEPRVATGFNEYLNHKFEVLKVIQARNLAMAEIDQVNKEIESSEQNLSKIKTAKETIENFATYLIYYHPKIKSSGTLSEMVSRIGDEPEELAEQSDRIYLEVGDDGEVREVDNSNLERMRVAQLSSVSSMNLPKEELLKYKKQQEEKLDLVLKEELKFSELIVEKMEKRKKIFAQMAKTITTSIDVTKVGHGSLELDLALAAYHTEENPIIGDGMVRKVAVTYINAPIDHPVVAYMRDKRRTEAYLYYIKIAASHLSKDQLDQVRESFSAQEIVETSISTNDVPQTNENNFRIFCQKFYGNLVIEGINPFEADIAEQLSSTKISLVLYSDEGIKMNDPMSKVTVEGGYLSFKNSFGVIDMHQLFGAVSDEVLWTACLGATNR